METKPGFMRFRGSRPWSSERAKSRRTLALSSEKCSCRWQAATLHMQRERFKVGSDGCEASRKTRVTTWRSCLRKWTMDERSMKRLKDEKMRSGDGDGDGGSRNRKFMEHKGTGIYF